MKFTPRIKISSCITFWTSTYLIPSEIQPVVHQLFLPATFFQSISPSHFDLLEFLRQSWKITRNFCKLSSSLICWAFFHAELNYALFSLFVLCLLLPASLPRPSLPTLSISAAFLLLFSSIFSYSPSLSRLSFYLSFSRHCFLATSSYPPPGDLKEFPFYFHSFFCLVTHYCPK